MHKRSWRWLEKSERFLQSRIVLLTACDSRYLGFAISLCRSLDVFSPGFEIIIYVINPTRTDVESLTALSRSLSATSISIAIEESADLSSYDDEYRRSYFASARFFFLNEMVEVADNIVLCVDADSLVIGPLSETIAKTKFSTDIALWRRDLEKEGLPDHLKVAAGVVAFFFSRHRARRFLNRLVNTLKREFDDGRAVWFVDQRALSETITDMGADLRAASLQPAYRAFEEYRTGVVILSAKGGRKNTMEPYITLCKLLSGSELDALDAKRSVKRLTDSMGSQPLREFLSQDTVVRLLPKSGTIYLPRLDLPWKKPRGDQVPKVADATVQVRLRWKEFAIHLASWFEANGIRIEVQEIPNWEINAHLVNGRSGDFAILPHRCRFEIDDVEIPAAFYMQEYMPWLFSVDRDGWGAGASVYPLQSMALRDQSSSVFSHYEERLRAGNLPTKFSQREFAQTRANETRYDIFFPLQIPHDQVIQRFSEVSEQVVLESLCEFAKSSGLRVVLKPHPANMKATSVFHSLVDDQNIFWSEDNFHDLVGRSRSVFTINSSVGFEAMLHLKPVVAFGRTLYDAVVIRGDVIDIGSAWRACQAWQPSVEGRRYREFFEWYCNEYSVDLSRPEARDRSIGRFGVDFLRQVYPSP